MAIIDYHITLALINRVYLLGVFVGDSKEIKGKKCGLLSEHRESQGCVVR